MAKKAVIVGWSHIPFGKLIEPDTETLMARVSGGALEHAGITGKDVDGIYVGVMNSGFQKQD
ncbi:MAG TPA: thiolase domain-containing protein, partial [Pusillimonas sp.]